MVQRIMSGKLTKELSSDIALLHLFLQLQKHDRENEDIPSKWRSEEEMAAEASDLRKQLEKPWMVN